MKLRSEGSAPPKIAHRALLFGLFVAISAAVFWRTLEGLVHLSLQYDYCSQIVLIPFLAAGLLYWDRRRIFDAFSYEIAGGLCIVVLGVFSYVVTRHYAAAFGTYDSLAAAAFAVVLVWLGGFLAFFGVRVFRAALFPLIFLFLMVPIPSYVLSQIIFYLQSGSTAVAVMLFHIFRMPVLREGFILALPGITIEVAKECSSIRSSVALLITSLLASYLFLRTSSRRTILVLLALPLAVFKNGVRVATLASLAIYVNPAVMTSKLHRDGGVLFFLLALVILLPVLLLLQKTEGYGRRGISPGKQRIVARGKSSAAAQELPAREA